VIRLIGVESGWNIIPDASVKPQHHVSLHDVDPERRLRPSHKPTTWTCVATAAS